MNDARASGVSGIARRLGSTLRTLGRRGAGHQTDRDAVGRSAGRGARDRQAELRAELARVRVAVGAAEQELEELTAERDRLREARLHVQQELGAQHGLRVMPRLKVEKTNGEPSLVAGARMMQRIHRRADDPDAGLDGAGAVLRDREAAALWVRSHGIPVVEGEARAGGTERSVVVHAFKGEVGLVEVRDRAAVRHFTADGEDPGDIRPAVPHDATLAAPEQLADICAWSRVLSAHVPRPYVQIHWAEGPARVESVDVDPDRLPVLTREWDRWLGSVFDGAYARFLLQPFRGGGLDNRVPGGTFSYEEGA